MRTRTKGLVVAVLAVLALGLAACGSDESNQATAEQDLCSSLSSFSAAVTGLQGLDPQSQKENWELQTEVVKGSWEQVQSDAQNVQAADTAALGSAVDDLESAVSSVPEGTGFSDALTQLQPQLTALHQAWTETWNGLDCAASSSSS